MFEKHLKPDMVDAISFESTNKKHAGEFNDTQPQQREGGNQKNPYIQQRREKPVRTNNTGYVPSDKERKRTANNYFTKQLKENGQNFFTKKNAQDLHRDALVIFRDISRGKMDVREYEQYFTNPQLVEIMLLVASENAALHSINMQGTTLYIQALQASNQQPNQFTHAVHERNKRSAEAFTTIYNYLLAMKTTGSINSFFPAVSILRNYRDYI